MVTFLLFSHLQARSLTGEDHGNLLFFQSTLMAGRNVANYSTFPHTGWRRGVSLDIGLEVRDAGKSYTSYYNYPQYGISLSMTQLGNDSALGKEFSITPFFVYNPFRNHQKGIFFRVGLGLSYFTRFYNSITNPVNESIGSSFTWAFHGIISKPVLSTQHFSIDLSLAYYHASNGHIQLPNFGLNAAMFGLACRFLCTQKMAQSTSKPELNADGKKTFFIYLRQGTGINELGGTTGPVGGRKGLIYSGTIAGGMLFNRHIKVRIGFTYRYYELIRGYDSETLPWNYSQSSKWFASNIYFFAGCEFLIGHFGMDVEGGLNMHKPFYSYFFDTFEKGGQLSYYLKKIFPTRMGLNYYFVNTEKNPRNNLSIGAHINANFGEADFSEFSIAYTRLLK